MDILETCPFFQSKFLFLILFPLTYLITELQNESSFLFKSGNGNFDTWSGFIGFIIIEHMIMNLLKHDKSTKGTNVLIEPVNK